MNDKIPSIDVVGGNSTLLQLSEIAIKHRLKLYMPATVIIGRSEFMNKKDRLIYFDRQQSQLVVK